MRSCSSQKSICPLSHHNLNRIRSPSSLLWSEAQWYFMVFLSFQKSNAERLERTSAGSQEQDDQDRRRRAIWQSGNSMAMIWEGLDQLQDKTAVDSSPTSDHSTSRPVNKQGQGSLPGECPWRKASQIHCICCLRAPQNCVCLKLLVQNHRCTRSVKVLGQGEFSM